VKALPQKLRSSTSRASMPAIARTTITVAALALAAVALPAAAALYEPKRLRLRILAVAGRLVRAGRRTTLKIDPNWPWATTITLAHTRLRALPVP